MVGTTIGKMVKEMFQELNISTEYHNQIENGARAIKQNSERLSFILCDLHTQQKAVTPIKLLSAIKGNSKMEHIKFFLYSDEEIDIQTSVRIKAVDGIGLSNFSTTLPIEVIIENL